MSTRMPTSPNQLPTQRVRAVDLPSALREVRGIFGEDALIVGTRTVMAKADGGLAPRRMVEVEVAEDPIGSLAGDPYSASYQEASRPVASDPVLEDTLRARLERMEAVAGEVQRVSDLVAGDDSLAKYPLGRALRTTGCTETTIEELAEAFALANRGGEVNPSAARRHLGKFLRGTSALRLDQVKGEHWFLGRAGVGKTSLSLQLAAELRRLDAKVAMIALAPQHDGELRRLEMASKALNVPAMVAYDATDLETARLELGATDVLLVDTPCHLSHPVPAPADEIVQRHLVVPLGEDPRVLRDQLRRSPQLEVDTLAISQMDLHPRPGRVVDLALVVGRPVSFLQGYSEGTLRLRLARGEVLLQAALGESDAGSEVPAADSRPRAAEARA